MIDVVYFLIRFLEKASRNLLRTGAPFFRPCARRGYRPFLKQNTVFYIDTDDGAPDTLLFLGQNTAATLSAPRPTREGRREAS